MENINKNTLNSAAPSAGSSSDNNNTISAAERRNNELNLSSKIVCTPLKANPNSRITFPEESYNKNNQHRASITPVVLFGSDWE